MWWTWRWMIAAHARRHRRVGIVLEQLDRGLQRLQRVAQLVREDREELVLAAIGLGHLLHLALEHLGLEPLALHRELALVRARLRLAQLLGLVARARSCAPGAGRTRVAFARSTSGRIGFIRKSNAPSS